MQEVKSAALRGLLPQALHAAFLPLSACRLRQETNEAKFAVVPFAPARLSLVSSEPQAAKTSARAADRVESGPSGAARLYKDLTVPRGQPAVVNAAVQAQAYGEARHKEQP